MSNQEAIALLRNLEDALDSYCELNEEGKTAFRMAIEALSCSENPNNSDCISRQAAIDAVNSLIDRFERILSDIRESKVDDSVCGLCEYDGAYMGQSGDWCNECPGFEKDDCFRLSDECRKRWLESVELPSAQPERKTGQLKYESAYNWFRCNVCRKIYPSEFMQYFDSCQYQPGFNFCPNCGADMRGEQDETD